VHSQHIHNAISAQSQSNRSPFAQRNRSAVGIAINIAVRSRHILSTITAQSQRNCSGVAAQSQCNRSVFVAYSQRNRSENAAQSRRKRSAIAAKTQRNRGAIVAQLKVYKNRNKDKKNQKGYAIKGNFDLTHTCPSNSFVLRSIFSSIPRLVIDMHSGSDPLR
jgi:hypothetical protein